MSKPGVRLASLHLLSSLLLAGAAVTAACSNGDAQLDPDVVGKGGARLELVFGGGRVDLARGVATPEPPSELGVPADLGTDLRWELISRMGMKLAEGSAPDSRIVHFEPKQGEQVMPDMKAPSGTLTVEIPDAAGTLRLYDSNNVLLGELEVDRLAGAYSADGWTGKADIDWDTDLIGSPVLLNGEGNPEGKFTILVVPEGYTEAEQPKFEADFKSMWDRMATLDVYKDHLDQLNVWRQNIKSAESGISDPRTNVVKDTAFNVSWGDDVTRVRRCTMPAANWEAVSVANVNRLGEMVKADVVVMIVNDTELAGCARGGLIVQSIYAADAGETLGHELGHALFGLADEYDYGGAGGFCRSGPNLARNLTAIPWQDLIDPSTPIPTTWNGDEAKVGAWEGGGTCSTGVWRPFDDCRMKSSFAPFCPVCARIVNTTFAARRDPSLGGQMCTLQRPFAATASGDDGNKPNNALDSKLDTRWSSNGNGQWLQLDLGGSRKISAVDVAWYKGTQRASNYVISVSTDGTMFSDVANGKSSGRTNYNERIAFAPVQAKYVRITVNGNSVNSWASITEAKVCQLP
ncbi:MAG: M64 family metallopeptidase [Kofleriaceae bacterium]